MSETEGLLKPPTTLGGILRYIGPGLILTATIVGSGEVIVTPKLGAEAGFTLLWFIILGCLVKVLVQVELGRFAVSKGVTTLEAMNMMPGPRFKVSWMLWLWVIMYVGTVFQVGGIVGGVATIFGEFGANWHGEPETNSKIWAVIVVTAIVGLLLLGKYKYLERFSMVMVGLFTLCTIFAVGSLQSTDFRITAENIASGFTFSLGEGGFLTAFAAFGVIGVGASELIFYPYWCIEKGYAKYTGQADGSPEWIERARGWMKVMRVDAWISLVIYTLATVAFYLLGAAILNREGVDVENIDMIKKLSEMYTKSIGPNAHGIFLFGAFFALFSTAFCATAANARLFADAAGLFGVTKYDTPEKREKWIRYGIVLLPVLSLVFWFLYPNPVDLVFIGAIAQGLMLPFLAIAALYFRHKKIDPALRPGATWTTFLWIAAGAMMAAGIFQVYSKLAG